MTLKWFATVAPGLEPLLRDEFAELGLRGRVDAGGLHLKGTLEDGWTIVLNSRLASGLRLRVWQGEVTRVDGLRSAVQRADWRPWIHPVQELGVSASITDNGWRRDVVERAVKKAIATSLRGPRRPGGRPPRVPARVHVRVQGRSVQVSVDAAGALLHKRGWRRDSVKAPLRENLAAAVLRVAGWHPDEPLLDPMCGSGTFLIEAAGIARGAAPGAHRRFALEAWPCHDARRYKQAVERARKTRQSPVRLWGSDRDPRAVKAALENARRARVASMMQVDVEEFMHRQPPATSGLVVMNPPWGTRLSANRARGVWSHLGEVLAGRYAEWRWALVGPDPGLARATGLPLVEAVSFPAGGMRLRVWTGSNPSFA